MNFNFTLSLVQFGNYFAWKIRGCQWFWLCSQNKDTNEALGLKSKGERQFGRPWAMWFRQTVESEREERQKKLEIIGPPHLTSNVPNIRRNAYCETFRCEGAGLVLVLLANCVNLLCLFSKLWTLTFKKQIPTAQETQHLHCNDQPFMLHRGKNGC